MEFGLVNYIVLGAYLALMLVIGWVSGRRIKTSRGFFVANGKLNYIVVGVSILGTYLSALTMMGLPGMSYGKHDWTYMVQLPFLIITAIVITRFVLPRYREAGVISVYAYLEQRIGIAARMIGSGSFILFALGRMGLVLYLPALAFSTVTGADLAFCIVVMGIIITVYTVMGGMEAVVWTDFFQVIIFVAGALLTIGFVFSSISFNQFIAIGQEYRKFRWIAPRPDSGKITDITQITTIWLILETIFQTIRIYATQQDVAQRYMTTESTKKAARSAWIGILAYIPLGFIFYFIGTALFVFYKVHPDASLPAKSDPVYPHFVMNQLPVGIAGLVIAAIFAAAMSSIDSCMNSASTVCIEDFFKRFDKREHNDREHLLMARLLTVVWGGIAILTAFLFINVNYVQIAWGKLMALTTNGILGLVALAFLPFKIRPRAAVTGFVVSTLYLAVIVFGGMTDPPALEINFLLWPVIGNTVCFLTALAVHRAGSEVLSSQ